jgi:hypothetical protein
VLKCREVTELATEYQEGALPARDWLGMRWHLLICSMCRAYLDQLDKTRRLLNGKPMPPPAPEVEAHLVAAAVAPPEQRP